jgi:hypothetical protein
VVVFGYLGYYND